MPKLAPVAARRAPESPEDIVVRRSSALARVGRYIAKLQEAGYFGKVTISFHNGELTELRTEQTMKIDNL